ncbi:hypothetical protein Tco_0586144 [Tanacetum coccineum]
MIQVKEMMQDNDLKNSKSKDKGSRSRSQSMNEQSHYKQDKTKTRQSINVKSHIFNVRGDNDKTKQTPTRMLSAIQRISLTGFPAQSVGSSNTDVLDSPCLLVLITRTSQSRQHVDTSLIHIESRKSPTAELFEVDCGRISIFSEFAYNTNVLVLRGKLIQKLRQKEVDKESCMKTCSMNWGEANSVYTSYIVSSASNGKIQAGALIFVLVGYIVNKEKSTRLHLEGTNLMESGSRRRDYMQKYLSVNSGCKKYSFLDM